MRPGRSRHSEIVQALRLLRAEADRRVLAFGMGTVAVVVAAGVLAALSPLVLKGLVDAVATAGRAGAPAALPWAVAYPGLLLAGRVLGDVRPLLSGTLDQRLRARLTHRFFDHVLRLPMDALLKRRGGELLHALDLGSAGAQLIVALLAGSLLPVLVELATMAAVLVHLRQPALVGVFAAAALAYLAIFSIGARLTTATARAVTAASLETHGQLGEALAHVETLRCFAAEDQASRRLLAATTRLERRWLRFNRCNAAIALAASLTFAAAMAASLRIGMDAVSGGALTVGGFVLTTVYLLQMVRPLESLGTAARDLVRALGCLRPLLELLAEPSSPDAIGAPAGAPAVAATTNASGRGLSVRVENLHFGYDPQRPVIKGVDLDLPAGSTTAIVGRSGSGKSSLARLLMRLHSPQQGRILLGGRAIDSIDPAELRRTLVGLVPQETALLHATIAANIALGSPAASRDDIRAAACAAQLQALLDALPQGLDTPVGERGMHLSGGERQRVGIARALLRRPRLFVLDEPTSSLDSRTELEIRAALRVLCGGATTIVIAHRLSTVVDADQIVVLDDGRIRERGSHPALLAQDGLYARMWRQQMAGAAPTA